MYTKWKLSKQLGFIMFILYLIFLAWALFLEFERPAWAVL